MPPSCTQCSQQQRENRKPSTPTPWQVSRVTEVKAVPLAVQHMQDPVVPPLAMEVGLALLGAALGGLLLTPIIRTMRSFVSALEVPEWATQQLRFPAWLSFTLHLNLVLPALGMVIWVCPAACQAYRTTALVRPDFWARDMPGLWLLPQYRHQGHVEPCPLKAAQHPWCCQRNAVLLLSVHCCNSSCSELCFTVVSRQIAYF